jgi:hypothetical protein
VILQKIQVHKKVLVFKVIFLESSHKKGQEVFKLSLATKMVPIQLRSSNQNGRRLVL